MSLPFPDINPVAYAIGPVQIRWYALAYLTGFMLGWQYCLYMAGLNKEERPNKTDIDDFLSWVILGVILGGRTGYVLFYQPDFYLSDPWEIPKVWHGGMSFHGGLTGVIIALISFCLVRKIPLLRLADMLACAAPIGLFFGRIANFVNGELYGRMAHVPWAIEFPGGGGIPRHPSQLYEAGLEGLCLFALLFLLMRQPAVREKPGVLSGMFLIGYGLSRIFVELFREPDVQIGLIMGMFSMGQILSLPMVIGGIILVLHAMHAHRKTLKSAS